ncbi:hypothetical protein LCGC14_0552040 [marine sediment metagenome]|uniref:Uncharacterized protein n=1 Tax=marine sediment metagenome TaxID=412755 RepID=A0A0F9UAU9_9ZZZZ
MPLRTDQALRPVCTRGRLRGFAYNLAPIPVRLACSAYCLYPHVGNGDGKIHQQTEPRKCNRLRTATLLRTLLLHCIEVRINMQFGAGAGRKFWRLAVCGMSAGVERQATISQLPGSYRRASGARTL